MMAITRHDPEWQRLIATAALAGVTFKQIAPVHTDSETRPGRFTPAVWEVTLPNGARFDAPSKLRGAVLALRRLEGLVS